jgi:hypothetical protein
MAIVQESIVQQDEVNTSVLYFVSAVISHFCLIIIIIIIM